MKIFFAMKNFFHEASCTKKIFRNFCVREIFFNQKFCFEKNFLKSIFWPFSVDFRFCTRIVVRVQKNLTKNRGVESSPDFCASHPKKLF